MLAPISAIRFPYAEPRSVASTNAASGPTSRNVGSACVRIACARASRRTRPRTCQAWRRAASSGTTQLASRKRSSSAGCRSRAAALGPSSSTDVRTDACARTRRSLLKAGPNAAGWASSAIPTRRRWISPWLSSGLPRFPIWSTSHTCGSHWLGNRPETRRSSSRWPSIPPSLISSFWSQKSRNAITWIGAAGVTSRSARRALTPGRSSRASFGRPTTSTRKLCSSAGRSRTSRRSERSRATTVAPRTTTSIAAPAAMPASSSALRPGLERRRATATRAGAAVRLHVRRALVVFTPAL